MPVTVGEHPRPHGIAGGFIGIVLTRSPQTSGREVVLLLIVDDERDVTVGMRLIERRTGATLALPVAARRVPDGPSVIGELPTGNAVRISTRGPGLGTSH